MTLLTLSVVTALCSSPSPKQSIAVIGGGFAGSSTAYYLNQLCDDCYDVTVFEGMPFAGGRVGHVTIPNTKGLTVDVGGDAWSRVNTYMMTLMKELDILQPTYPSRGYNTSGLYLGPGRGWEGMATNKTVDPRIIKDAIAQILEIAKIEEALDLNYLERGDLKNGKPYNSIAEFAHAGGLDTFSNHTLKELLQSHGVSDVFIKQLIEPMTRDIYDQPSTINGFAGMAVLLSSTTAEYSAKGGNDMMVKKLLSTSKAKVFLSSPVSEVSVNSDGKITLTVNGTATSTFDKLVLAAPVEQAGVWSETGLTPIKWTGFNLPSMKMRKYVYWYVIWVVADSINSHAFDRDDVMPDITLTPENSTALFVKLAAEYNIIGSQQKAFRFFSNNPIDDLSKRFVNPTWNQTFHWPYTFPELAPEPLNYQPVKLHQNIYYPNALESMAVAMECAVIGGRNAAQMIHRDSQ